MDIYTPSDCRIKHSICPVSVLSNIDKLNFVSYCTANSTQSAIGVIAQELKEIFPDMVNCKEGILSNINTVAEHTLISNNIVFIRYISTGQIKENDTYAFNANTNIGGVFHTCIVSNVTDESFEIKPWIGYSPNDRLTIIGCIIPDFHSVNYTELSMLGPAGVKELHQIVKQQGATICAQQEQITALQEQVATILAKLG